MAAGVAYATDEEMVVLQRRPLETVDVLLFPCARYRYGILVLGAVVRVELGMGSCGS